MKIMFCLTFNDAGEKEKMTIIFRGYKFMHDIQEVNDFTQKISTDNNMRNTDIMSMFLMEFNHEAKSYKYLKYKEGNIPFPCEVKKEICLDVIDRIKSWIEIGRSGLFKNITPMYLLVYRPQFLFFVNMKY